MARPTLPCGTADDGAAEHTRYVELEGANNVRDLGGYATEDGRTVTWGKVYRAESTQALAEALTGVMRGGDPAVVEEMLGDGEAQRIKDESFVAQLDQPEAMEGYGQTLQLIADNPGALSFHCTAGKDRTGMMSALLLGILGVSDAVIVEDFELSNEYLADHYAKTYAVLEEQGVDVELIRPLTEQHASNIQPVLDAVHDQYGGWDAFATEKLGVDQETLDELREKLLD